MWLVWIDLPRSLRFRLEGQVTSVSVRGVSRVQTRISQWLVGPSASEMDVRSNGSSTTTLWHSVMCWFMEGAWKLRRDHLVCPCSIVTCGPPICRTQRTPCSSAISFKCQNERHFLITQDNPKQLIESDIVRCPLTIWIICFTRGSLVFSHIGSCDYDAREGTTKYVMDLNFKPIPIL